MRATHRLLKVVMCLKNQKKSEYIIGVATSLSVLEWMKSVDHPVWKMLVADPTMLLEEIGEISFSVLARSLNTGVRQDRDRVSKLYKLSHKQIETAQKLKVDNENNDDFLNNMIGKYIDPNHETVQAVTAYFSSAMRQLKALTYKSYPQGHSVNIANSNAGDAIAVDLDIEPRIWLQPKCDLIPVVLKEMKERLRSHWVTNFKEIWPEVNPPESSMQSNQARRPGHVRRDDGSQIQARGVGGNNNSNRNQSNSVMRSDQKEEKKNIKSKKKRKKTAKSNATRPKKKKKKKRRDDSTNETISATAVLKIFQFQRALRNWKITHHGKSWGKRHATVNRSFVFNGVAILKKKIGHGNRLPSLNTVLSINCALGGMNTGASNKIIQHQ